jgi:hypothetical protein
MTKRLFFLLPLIFIYSSSFSQLSNLVKSDSIIYSIHQRNMGKIAFMEKNIPIETFQESDFLTSFELKGKIDLNIRVFMRNSLTNYLHTLSPQSGVEELIENGNYQFTFLVDDKKIYEENLNVGAGSADSKNQKTVFRVPFISSSNEDSWGRFLWNRFLITGGGQDALTSGTHVLKIEIRPYLKLTEILVGDLIAEGQVTILVPEVKVDEKWVRIQAIKPLKD